MKDKFIALVVVILTTITLTACGGGGGGSTQILPSSGGNQTGVRPTITNLVFAIPSGATNVAKDSSVMMQVSVTNTTSVTGTITTTKNGTPVSSVFMAPWTVGTSTATSSISLVTEYGTGYTHTLHLTAHGPSGDSIELVGSLTFTVEQAPVLSYTDKVYTIHYGKYPYYVHRNNDGSFELAKVRNMTSFTTGVFPLYNCMMANTPLADGKVLTACADAISNSYHHFYIDPTKEELYEYYGVIPANLQYTENPDKSINLPSGHDWNLGVNESNPSPPAIAANVTVGVGTYYVNWSDWSTLLFRDSIGTVYTVRQGDPGDNATTKRFYLLIAYSH